MTTIPLGHILTARRAMARNQHPAPTHPSYLLDGLCGGYEYRDGEWLATAWPLDHACSIEESGYSMARRVSDAVTVYSRDHGPGADDCWPHLVEIDLCSTCHVLIGVRGRADLIRLLCEIAPLVAMLSGGRG